MQTNKWVREQMLAVLSDKIDDSFSGGKGYVEFFDSAGTSICILEFDLMEIQATTTDNSVLRFRSIDGSYTLKGSATESSVGGVTEFRIKGTVDDSPLTEGNVIVGSVGNISSSADLKFNIVSWQPGTFVTIKDFSIIFPNGS